MSARSWWLLVLAIVALFLLAAEPAIHRALFLLWCLFLAVWSYWYDHRFPLDR